MDSVGVRADSVRGLGRVCRRFRLPAVPGAGCPVPRDEIGQIGQIDEISQIHQIEQIDHIGHIEEIDQIDK